MIYTVRKISIQNKKIKLLWQIVAIVLVNAFVITIIAFAASRSSPTLSRLGSRGEEVRQVQTKLKSLGLYTGSVDGIYGTGTQKAVRQFQKNCGLTVDGIAGPKDIQAVIFTFLPRL